MLSKLNEFVVVNQVSDWPGEARDPERGGPSHQRDTGAGEEPAAAPGRRVRALDRGGESAVAGSSLSREIICLSLSDPKTGN